MQKHVNGIASELAAAAWFVEQGWIVSRPLSDFYEYDLVIDDKKAIRRVQVKTAYWDTSKKRFLVSCVTSHIRGNHRRTNKKYANNSFDILCAVEKATNAVYVIPKSQVVGRRSITLYPNGKPATVGERYDDFEQYRVR